MVALGGAVGALARYGVAVWLSVPTGRFPFATLAVNLAGSFAIGLLGPALLRHDAWRLLVVTGVLGGFTTFSAFSLETLALFQAGRTGAALIYVIGSVAGGVLCAALGFALGRWLSLPHS